MSKKRQEPLELLARCEAAGCTVKPTRKGWQVKGPNGLVHLHKTPSDHRGNRNSISDLRKIGVEL